ncbi:phage holin family protein [Sphingomonas sanguinis]|uniref:phage holin family protein n=1 Tax=Sphingomonas sp. LC-1 TaxID=3110957 RepID=UPI0021BABF68|nr:phage holin family protein [Sphingomonas sp. LC-1]MCT8002168.1 phage holin family protein [Sphingomonas sp. LC-1]
MTRVTAPLSATRQDPETLTSLVSQLVDDGRSYITAEIDLAKARASDKIARYRSAAIFIGAAAVLALAALIALLVGLIFALAPATGPLGATLIVVGVVLVAAGVLAMIGKSRLTGGAA